MSELKAITAYEANWKAESYGDNNVLVYLKSNADKVIKDIIEGAMSMFREPNRCRGLDTKSPLGRIADVAFKHWNRVEHTMSNNRQLRLDKANLLRSNEYLHTQIKSEIRGRINDKIEYSINIRHSNHKRCLAMADALTWEHNYLVDFVSDDFPNVRFKRRHRIKWVNRWLALAEEPTWAKFLQLIHKEAK